MVDTDFVTQSQCEKYRLRMKEDMCESICQEREDRKESVEKLEAWLYKIDEKMDQTNNWLRNITIELLFALIGIIVVYLLGKI